MALSVESKSYSVRKRSLSLKSVGDGEEEWRLSISAMAREMSLSFESLAFFCPGRVFNNLPSKIGLEGLPKSRLGNFWGCVGFNEKVNLRRNVIYKLFVSYEEGVKPPIASGPKTVVKSYVK